MTSWQYTYCYNVFKLQLLENTWYAFTAIQDVKSLSVVNMHMASCEYHHQFIPFQTSLCPDKIPYIFSLYYISLELMHELETLSCTNYYVKNIHSII